MISQRLIVLYVLSLLLCYAGRGAEDAAAVAVAVVVAAAAAATKCGTSDMFVEETTRAKESKNALVSVTKLFSHDQLLVFLYNSLAPFLALVRSRCSVLVFFVYADRTG